MKNYELMYILVPELDENQIKEEITALNKILIDNGASIEGVNEWGLRDLAYEIKKQTKGYYVIISFTSDPIACQEFTRLVRLNQKVLRFLITTN